jgi:hypothetical protein
MAVDNWLLASATCFNRVCDFLSAGLNSPVIIHRVSPVVGLLPPDRIGP